jgi:acyl-CoA thioesterase
MTGRDGHPHGDAHLSRLRELIHDLDRLAPIARLVEARFLLIEAGRVKIQYAVKPEFMHPGRAVQGGIVTVYADMAMAMAGQTLCRAEEFLVTSQLSISFLAPVTRGPVVAEGTVVKRGRTSYFLEATVKDTDGLALARATSIGLAKVIKH